MIITVLSSIKKVDIYLLNMDTGHWTSYSALDQGLRVMQMQDPHEHQILSCQSHLLTLPDYKHLLSAFYMIKWKVWEKI